MILITGLAMTLLFVTESNATELWGIDIHGFISLGYLSTTENDLTGRVDEKLKNNGSDDFAFDEVGINFGKELTDNLRAGIQLFARNYGNSGGNKIQIDWAFADYYFNDWLGIRFGQIKQPHGLYNEVRDIDILRNPIFLPESVYHDLSQHLFVQDVYLSVQGAVSRDLYLSLQGVGLYGYIDMDTAGGFSYQIMYGIQNIDPNQAISKQSIKYFSETFGEDEESTATGEIETEKIDVDYKYAGNLVWDAPFDGLRMALSLDNIKMSTTARFTEDFTLQGIPIPLARVGDTGTADYKKLQSWVGSIEYTWNNLLLTAEVIQTFKEYTMDFAAINETKKSDPWGWYAGGVLRFTDWIEFGAYFSQTKNDDTDMTTFLPPIDYFIKFNDLCATLRFDINKYWALKLEAHSLNGEYAKVNPENPLSPNYRTEEDSWHLYTAKMTVTF